MHHKDRIDYIMEAREAADRDNFPEQTERRMVLERRTFFEKLGDFLGLTDTYEDYTKQL